MAPSIIILYEFKTTINENHLNAAGITHGGFIAAFIFSELITIGGYFAEIEWGYVLAFVFFIAMMFLKPEGLFTRKS